MSTLELITAVEMPEYALPYLVNGDSSGLSDEDIKTIDAAIESLNDETGITWKGLVFDYDMDMRYFSWRPFFGLACDAVECKIYGHRNPLTM